MSAKSYSIVWSQQGLHGEKQAILRVYNVSNGDYITVGSDFSKITQAAYIGISGQAPLLSSMASGQFPTAGLTCLTLTSTATVSLVADAVDVLMYGPAAGAS